MTLETGKKVTILVLLRVRGYKVNTNGVDIVIFWCSRTRRMPFRGSNTVG